jgi:hypothetical protein
MMKRFMLPSALAVGRTFFNKGWDNAALDTVFSAMLRKPEINDRLKTLYVQPMDPRDADILRKGGDLLQKKGVEGKKFLRIFLPPHLGDAHRLLKAYSLTAYPILDDKGEQLKVDIDGHHLDAFADPDDDYSKIVIQQLEATEYLATNLLTTLKWEASPRGAASLLEHLYRGAEIPDHVFQTPAIIERIQVKQ